MSEWRNYKTGKPSTTSFINVDCQPLERIAHVAHVETAIRILKDSRIKSGLIFDKSKLRTGRVLVNWLSPNTWAYGSRYGNVEFWFDFKKLVEGFNYYWVESMMEYTPHACRILITERDHPSLVRYYPEKEYGPWIYEKKTDEHFWNGNYTLEFMFEDDLSVHNCDTIEFTGHHKNFCNIDPSNCLHRGLSNSKASMLFFANILANDIPIEIKHFRESYRGGDKPKQNLKYGIDQILYNAHKKNYSGSAKHSDTIAVAITKAALNFRAHDHSNEYKEMLNLFNSFDDYAETIYDLAMEKFGITNRGELMIR